MARALQLLIGLCLFAAVAQCTTYTVYAGAASTDGNWVLLSYYPWGTVDFSITAGDSIVFVVGGFPKTIVITDRPFIPLVDDDTGLYDPTLVTASGSNPITVVFPSNETYSSGLLPVGSNFTFTFASEGAYELFEIMEGKTVATVNVNPAGTPNTYTPAQIDRYARDAISRDEVTGYETLAAATAASGAPAGSIALGYAAAPLSYTGYIGGNPIQIFLGSAVTFINRDVRPLNVFMNTSNEITVPQLPFGGPTFLTASGSSIEGTNAVSSGLIYTAGTFSITMNKLGTFTWISTISGQSGNVTVVKPPPKPKPLAGGRAFAAFVVIVAILLLIFVIGCIVIIACKYACIQAKQLEARAEQSFSKLHLTDNL